MIDFCVEASGHNTAIMGDIGLAVVVVLGFSSGVGLLGSF